MPDQSRQLSQQASDLSEKLAAVDRAIGALGTTVELLNKITEGAAKAAEERAADAKRRAQEEADDNEELNKAETALKEGSLKSLKWRTKQSEKVGKLEKKQAQDRLNALQAELANIDQNDKRRLEANRRAQKAQKAIIRRIKEESAERQLLLKEMRLGAKAWNNMKSTWSKMADSRAGKGIGFLDKYLGLLLGGAGTAAGIMGILNASNKSWKAIAGAAGVSATSAGSLRKDFNAAAGDLAALGFSLEEVGEIGTAVVKEFGSGLAVTETSLETVGVLAKGFGISIDEAASSFKTLTVTMGVATSEAEAFADSIRRDAVSGGVSASLVFKDLATFAANTTRSFGYTPEQLKKAAIRARQLGTTMDDMAGVSENFETMEGSLEIAQKASILFGTKLNAIELTRLSRQGKHAELQDKIYNSVRSQVDAQGEVKINDVAQAKLLEQMLGKNWKNILKARKAEEILSKQTFDTEEERAAAQQLMLADSKSFAEISKGGMRGLIREKAKQLETEKSLRENAEALQTIFDRIKNMFMRFILPYVTHFEGILQSAFGTGDKAKGTFKEIGNSIKESFFRFTAWAKQNKLVEKSFDFIAKIIRNLPKFITKVKQGWDKVSAGIQSAFKWIEENPTLSKMIGLLAAGAIGKKFLGGDDAPTGAEGDPISVKVDGLGASIGLPTDEASVGSAGGVFDAAKGGRWRNTAAAALRTGRTLSRSGGAAGKAAGAVVSLVGKTMSSVGNLGGGVIKALGKAFGFLSIGKSILSKIPGLGLIISLYTAWDRFKKGDYLGAVIDFAGGVASLFPGVGTGVAVGLAGVNLARDFSNDTASGVDEGSTSMANAARPGSGVLLPGYAFGGSSLKRKKSKNPRNVRAPKPNKVGEMFKGPRIVDFNGGPAVVSEEEGREEGMVPFGRIRRKLPIDGGVARSLKSIGWPGYGMGGTDRTFSQRSSSSDSRANERAATALMVASGDFKQSEKRLSKAIRHTTAMQENMADTFDDIAAGEIKREKDKKGFDLSWLAMLGKQLEAAEGNIEANKEVYRERGRLGKWLTENSKLVGDVGRFLQLKNKKEAAINIGLSIIQAKLKSIAEQKKEEDPGSLSGIIAGAIADGMARGTKPTTKALFGLASGLEANKAAMIQRGAAAETAALEKAKQDEASAKLFSEIYAQGAVGQEIDRAYQIALEQGISGQAAVIEAQKQMQAEAAAKAAAIEAIRAEREKAGQNAEAEISQKEIEQRIKDMEAAALREAQLKVFHEQNLAAGKSEEESLKLVEQQLHAHLTATKDLEDQMKATEEATRAQTEAQKAAENSRGARASEHAKALLENTSQLMESGASFKDALKATLLAKSSEKIEGKLTKEAGELGTKIGNAGMKMEGQGGLMGGLGSVMAFAGPLLPMLVPLIMPYIIKILKKLPEIIKKIPEYFKKIPALFKKIFTIWFKLQKMIWKFVGKLIKGLFKFILKWFKFFYITLPKKIFGFVKAAFSKIIGFFKGIPKALVKAVKKIFSKLKFWSEGTVVNKPTLGMVGETGEKEVVVPVERIKNGGKVNPEVMSEVRSLMNHLGPSPNTVNLGSGGSESKGGTDSNAALISEIRALRAEISALADRPVTITMDGKRVANAVSSRFEQMANNYG